MKKMIVIEKGRFSMPRASWHLTYNWLENNGSYENDKIRTFKVVTHYLLLGNNNEILSHSVLIQSKLK